MTITGISTNVQALLDNMPELVTVLAAPPTSSSNFAGYPSACHYYVNAESNYATVSQNRRVIEYVVELYVKTRNDTPTATELSRAYTLTDSVIQMFDESIDLSSVTLGLARACDIMRPTPANLERVQLGEGSGLMMTIRLFCEADVTFR